MVRVIFMGKKMEFHRVGSSYVLNKGFILNILILRKKKLADFLILCYYSIYKGQLFIPSIHIYLPTHIHFFEEVCDLWLCTLFTLFEPCLRLHIKLKLQ